MTPVTPGPNRSPTCSVENETIHASPARASVESAEGEPGDGVAVVGGAGGGGDGGGQADEDPGRAHVSRAASRRAGRGRRAARGRLRRASRSAASAIALTATQARPPPTLIRCAPASKISWTESIGRASTLTGFETAAQTSRISACGTQSRRVEDVGAGLLERLEAGDRVVEVGVAADVVLGARGQHEGPAERPGRLHGRRDPLERVPGVVERAGGVPVLDRASRRPACGRPQHRVRGGLGLGAVAVLEVGGDRERSRGVELGTCAATSSSDAPRRGGRA